MQAIGVLLNLPFNLIELATSILMERHSKVHMVHLCKQTALRVSSSLLAQST